MGLACGAFLSSTAKSFTFGVAQERMTLRLRDQAFNVLVNQKASYYDMPENARGTLTSHLATDPNDARTLLFGQLNSSLSALSIITTGCTIALYFCARFGGLMLGISPVTTFSGVQGEEERGVVRF